MHIWMSSLRDLLRGEVRSGLPRRSLVAASAVGGDWSRHARRADPSPTPMRSELPLRLYLFGPLRAFIDSDGNYADDFLVDADKLLQHRAN